MFRPRERDEGTLGPTEEASKRFVEGALSGRELFNLSTNDIDDIWAAANALMWAGAYERARDVFDALEVLEGPSDELAWARAACEEIRARMSPGAKTASAWNIADTEDASEVLP
jgi:hypothetical protein